MKRGVWFSWCLECLQRNYEDLEKQNFVYVLWKFKFQIRMFKLITVTTEHHFSGGVHLLEASSRCPTRQPEQLYKRCAGRCSIFTVSIFSTYICLLLFSSFSVSPPTSPSGSTNTLILPDSNLRFSSLSFQCFLFADMISEKNFRTSFPLDCSFQPSLLGAIRSSVHVPF